MNEQIWWSTRKISKVVILGAAADNKSWHIVDTMRQKELLISTEDDAYTKAAYELIVGPNHEDWISPVGGDWRVPLVIYHGDWPRGSNGMDWMSSLAKQGITPVWSFEQGTGLLLQLRRIINYSAQELTDPRDVTAAILHTALASGILTDNPVIDGN